MFHGLPSEDPIDHLDEFDRLCDLTKINGVSEDAIKLRLFPMSLADKAHQWEKSLPHGTITTWDECKKAFLAKFFSTGRTAKLRGEISSFIQRNNETFAEAWERFKGYTSQCPHHGFNNESLLSTLYRGCLPRYREMLDTASNGNFLNQDVDDGWQLVENIANSNGSYGEEYDRTNRSSTHHSIESDEKLRKDVKALNEKLDKLILAQSTMKKVNFVSAEEMEPVQEGEDTQFAEVCYMSNGQGGYNKGYYNYKSNPAMSYRNTDVANPQDQVYPQQQAARSSQGHNMGFPHQPPQPAPSQENELKAMLKQLLQGQADGVVDTSKKLAEINSRSRTSTQGFTLWRIMLLLLLLLQSKDNYLVKLFRTPRNSARSSSLKKDLLKKRIKKGSIESTLARSSPTSSVQTILLDPYQPVATSSSRLLSQGHKEVIHKFRRDLSGIGIELPPMDSMSEAFDQMQMVKDVLANSDKVSEVKDQGKFTLPCTLGHLEIDNALVDSGASINLISLSMAEKLGIAGTLQRPTTSIMFGDATSERSCGETEGLYGSDYLALLKFRRFVRSVRVVEKRSIGRSRSMRVSHLLFPENLFFYDAFRRGKESVADGKYGPHAKSKLDEEGLVNFRREYNIPDEIELVLPTESEGLEHVFWSILEHMGQRSMEDLAHGRSSTGSHLEDQLDHLLDQPVEFLNSTGQASTRSS
ncbi:unnamed protein product [Microthlaspi erraticum]|uniref:Retrotransposon gag domain-containing protein n=1 Tax=Microthlaspi erraticum TaxID=1685480 RepID=A0A6D2IP08_9BRAS|nr:unnamed protein product [Microthlaspi erraticum]